MVPPSRDATLGAVRYVASRPITIYREMSDYPAYPAAKRNIHPPPPQVNPLS